MPAETSHYFDSWESINAAFAGNLTGNLRYFGKELNVDVVSRDSWIKISSEDPHGLERAIRFLEQLENRSSESPAEILPQSEFEQILRAFRNDEQAELPKCFSHRVNVGPKKNDVVPRNKAQIDYIRQIRGKEIVFGVGPAGTGKTYLAMACAVSELLAEKHDRIILTRPAREAGEALGFLPGNLEEKILPYLRPLYDALYDMLDVETVANLIAKNIIEVAPLAFMRGRTLNNSFIILDEAQNTTTDQMLMFLTRIGFNSKCVVTGDPSQTDLDDQAESGLSHAKKVLGHISEIGFCQFTTKDIVRHSLIEKIVRAYQKIEKPRSNRRRVKRKY